MYSKSSAADLLYVGKGLNINMTFMLEEICRNVDIMSHVIKKMTLPVFLIYVTNPKNAYINNLIFGISTHIGA